MNAWKVQAARITVFPLLASGSPPKSALDLYKSVWGKDPDSFQNQVLSGSPFPNSIAQGVVGKLSRSCQSQLIRADFTFGPAAATVGSALPSVEDTDFLSTEMMGLIGSIDNAFQQTPLNRVASYMQLGQEASDYRQANQIVSGAMWQHQKVSLNDEEDFVLQINRTDSDATDRSIKLNFITKWSVERVQVMTFFTQMSPDGGPGVANAPTVIEKIIPTIALDNSNMPLQKPFDQNETGRVLSELFRGVSAQLKECNISIKGF
jgi:hypothetical protein